MYGDRSLCRLPRVCSHELLKPSETRLEKSTNVSFISTSCSVHFSPDLFTLTHSHFLIITASFSSPFTSSLPPMSIFQRWGRFKMATCT